VIITARTSVQIERPMLTAWTTLRRRDDDVGVDRKLLGGPPVLALDEGHPEDEHGDHHGNQQRRRRLGHGHHDGHRAGEERAEAVDAELPAPAGGPLSEPVHDHPGLADREGDEHADRIQRDERRRVPTEQHEQAARDQAQDDHA
jgi:hypothetical protein